MKSETRNKWLSFIRLFQSSSLSLNDFARQQGLNSNTFRNYYYRLRHQCQDNDLEFLPVCLEPSPTPEQSTTTITVRLSQQVTVILESLPPPGYLAELVAALEEA